MLPPRARRFSVADLAELDDEALRIFLDPADGGVKPGLLGLALQSHPELAGRCAASLPPSVRPEFERARCGGDGPERVGVAGRRVVEQLFWPMLYWHDPDAYLELVSGEEVPQALIDAVPLHGRIVADLGAGGGRFTVAAAQRAARVIAVDAVPALLVRLEARVRAAGLGNVEARRAGFRRLPLEDRSVDVAVFCSSLTQRGPHGGGGALAEAERVVCRGGTIVVIWPDNLEWLLTQGFSLLTAAATRVVRFPDPVTAERLCRDFYGDAAGDWVRTHRATTVPFHVIGRATAGVACIRRMR